MDAALRNTTSAAAPRPQIAVIALSIAYVALVVIARLVPLPVGSEHEELPGGVLNIANWFATATWARGLTTELVLNVVVFIPIGLIAGRFLRSWGMRILLPIALAFAIEAIQLPIPYRVSDPRDIAANTIGALIGIAVVWIVMAYQRDRELGVPREA